MELAPIVISTSRATWAPTLLQIFRQKKSEKETERKKAILQNTSICSHQTAACVPLLYIQQQHTKCYSTEITSPVPQTNGKGLCPWFSQALLTTRLCWGPSICLLPDHQDEVILPKESSCCKKDHYTTPSELLCIKIGLGWIIKALQNSHPSQILLWVCRDEPVLLISSKDLITQPTQGKLTCFDHQNNKNSHKQSR